MAWVANEVVPHGAKKASSTTSKLIPPKQKFSNKNRFTSFHGLKKKKKKKQQQQQQKYSIFNTLQFSYTFYIKKISSYKVLIHEFCIKNYREINSIHNIRLLYSSILCYNNWLMVFIFYFFIYK